MTTAPARPRIITIDAVGAARRLQALACARYGVAHLADMLVAGRMHVKHWQRHTWRTIHLATHQRIDYVYQRLWDTEGPSTLAHKHARMRGWHDFDAWTERTIDNPGAPPYSDPDQVNYIDWVLLERVRTGRRRYLDLSDAEKVALLIQHLNDGGGLRAFRDRYRPVPKRELDYLIVRQPSMWPLLNPTDLPRQARRQEASFEDFRLAG